MAWIGLALTACGADAGEEVAVASALDPLAGPGSATHPAVAPDGSLVAFMSNAVGVRAGQPINFEIYVVDAAGGESRRLTDNEAFDADIAWSPDGARIAYKSHQDGNDEIYLVGADGAGRRNLTAHPASDGEPHWSPDGATLAFSSDRGGTRGLFVLDLATRAVETLLDDHASESSPRWSPDGARIAFVSGAEGNDDLFVMNRDGSGRRRLTSSLDADWSPRWSPDGRTLLYVSGSFDDDRWDLYALEVGEADDVDGSPAQPVLLVPGVDSGNAAWHPSGELIYFGRYVDGESRLFVADADGSNARSFGG